MGFDLSNLFLFDLRIKTKETIIYTSTDFERALFWPIKLINFKNIRTFGG